MDSKRPDCPYCNSSHIISRGLFWQCKGCKKQWSKKYDISEIRKVFGDINNPFLVWAMYQRGLKTLPSFPKNTTKEREFYIWLAGLLSSDGSITLNSYSKRASKRTGFDFSVTLTSKEEDWILNVQEKALSCGLSSTTYLAHRGSTYPHTSYLCKKVYTLRFTSRIVAFYLMYYAYDWLMKRKREKLVEYLNLPVISKLYKYWSEVTGNYGEY